MIQRIMKAVGGAIILSLTVVASGAFATLEAQGRRGPGPVGGMRGMGPGLGIELALEKRAELGLSAEQVDALEVLRQDAAPDLERLRSERAGIMERVRSGELSREQMRVEMGPLMREQEEVMAPYRERMEGILSEGQRAQLQEMMRQQRRRPGGRG